MKCKTTPNTRRRRKMVMVTMSDATRAQLADLVEAWAEPRSRVIERIVDAVWREIRTETK